MTKSVAKLSKPPAYFSDAAKAIWKHTVDILNKTGVVKSSDSAIVEAFVLNYENLIMAYRDIQEHGQQQAIYKTVQTAAGQVLTDKDGKIKRDFVGYKINPAVKIFSDCSTKIKQLSSDLGLSPASRAQLLDLGGNGDSADLEAELKKFF